MVDTNLLVYYFEGIDMQKHRVVRRLLESDELRGNFVIAQQNLREFASVFFEKKKMSSVILLQHLAVVQHMFKSILQESASDVSGAIALSDEFKTSYWDSLLATTAQRYGVCTIYTENVKDFEKIPGIKVVNPLK